MCFMVYYCTACVYVLDMRTVQELPLVVRLTRHYIYLSRNLLYVFVLLLGNTVCEHDIVLETAIMTCVPVERAEAMWLSILSIS